MEFRLTQLSLPVSQTPDSTFANFCVTQNQIAVDFLQSAIADMTVQQQDTKIIYLQGEDTVGKTHLLYASCHYARKLSITESFIDMQSTSVLAPSIVQGFEDSKIICIDNIDAIIAFPDWQEVIFDLINQLIEINDGLIVFAGKKSPSKLINVLPDLISRFNWGTRFNLKPYNDVEKAQIIVTQARSRGITLNSNVAQYVLQRFERDLGKLTELLRKLDKVSLQEQRAITIPFIKQVL